MLQPKYSIAIHNDVEKIETEWRALEEHAWMTPYQKWDLIKAWLDSVGLPDNAQLTIAVVTHSDHVVCILPMMIKPCGFLKVLTWLADAHFNYHGGLYDREFITTLSRNEFDELWQTITASLPRFDYLEFKQQAREWDGHFSPFDSIDQTPSANATHQLIFPHHDFEQLLNETRSKSTRKRIRNEERRFQREGELVCEVVEGLEANCDYLQQLFAQRSARFQELGIKLEANQKDYQAFYENVLINAQKKQDQSAFLMTVKLDDELLATGLMLLAQNKCYTMLNSMTNTQRRQLSPGDLLLRRVLAYCCDHNIKLIDMGAGNDHYKTAWCNHEITLFDSFKAESLLGHVAVPLLRCSNMTKRRIKNSKLAWQFYRKVRAFRATKSLVKKLSLAIAFSLLGLVTLDSLAQAGMPSQTSTLVEIDCVMPDKTLDQERPPQLLASKKSRVKQFVVAC